MKRTSRWLMLAGVLAVLAVLGYRHWQGPVLPAYRLSATTLLRNVVATGRVVSVARAQVGSEITGVVAERRVEEGQRVKAGDVLLTLRSDEFQARRSEALSELDQLRRARWPQAQARLRQAEAQLAQARREADRRKVLAASQAIPREAQEQAANALATALADEEQARLEAARLAPGGTEEAVLRERLAAADAALSKTVLRAGFDGTVLVKAVEAGDLVQPGQVLFELARDGGVEVLVPLDERNLGVLRVGQSAVCIADAYPDDSFRATVKRIAPSVDPMRGTVDVRLDIEAPPPYLRDDLTVTATISTGRRENAIAVPNDSLFESRGRTAVAMAVRNGIVERVPVALGLKGLVMTEVTSGLRAGDLVLNRNDVEPGTRVRVTDLAPPAARPPDGDVSAMFQ
ncbi:efflux RND transporter periplasmic adaptor subunit [Parapusillimonas granuli]|nr:efflux RND transporter periplasmic adaptor subunit [Parapusillimonas granuli]MBB5213643.1 HlyD family secretion protein [Parapusillimonas granuli]MEB2398735.1 efflux RND transporter periplasmic adaptor subunit [Alcaligenaceae bacterium]